LIIISTGVGAGAFAGPPIAPGERILRLDHCDAESAHIKRPVQHLAVANIDLAPAPQELEFRLVKDCEFPFVALSSKSSISNFFASMAVSH
jgi:hypothetical protein